MSVTVQTDYGYAFRVTLYDYSFKFLHGDAEPRTYLNQERASRAAARRHREYVRDFEQSGGRAIHTQTRTWAHMPGRTIRVTVVQSVDGVTFYVRTVTINQEIGN